ncbi:MAG: hypothetical protein ACFHVJ_19070 [Aestuariibacter sp.]
MTVIHIIGFYLHILAGSAALLLVWMPMTVKKGSLDHKKFGRYYHNVMMLVAGSGAVIATLVIIDPILIHGARLQETHDRDIFITKMRVFYSLLLYLSLLVYVGLKHGEKVLECKTDTTLLNRWQHLLPNYLLVLAGVPLFSAGWLNNMTLAMIFPFLGAATGISHILYSTGRKSAKNQWLQQHLSAYIGTAIGAYTAFLAFGGRTLLNDIGQWQIAFWIMPGVIGSFVIRHFSIKYAPKPTAQ